jgi:hypothetical protein
MFINLTLEDIENILTGYGFEIYMNGPFKYARKDTIDFSLLKAFKEHLKQKLSLSDTGGNHSHDNKTILDAIEQSFTTTLKSTYDGYASGKEPANTNIQTHVTSAHAPSNAQKNSDITKAEIEAKLTGEISTHTHAGGGGGLTQPQVMSRISLSI